MSDEKIATGDWVMTRSPGDLDVLHRASRYGKEPFIKVIEGETWNGAGFSVRIQYKDGLRKWLRVGEVRKAPIEEVTTYAWEKME